VGDKVLGTRICFPRRPLGFLFGGVNYFAASFAQRHRSLFSISARPTFAFVAFVAILSASSTATSGGLSVEKHETSGIINLIPGGERGTITQPLQIGTIEPTGQTVYFVITDASDKKFARKFGAIRADSLEEAPAAAVETAIFKKGKWTFFEDPGLINRFDPASPATFDPFQMDDKGVTCSNFAAEVTGNGDGFIEDLIISTT
jgi:hypothetical protein